MEDRAAVANWMPNSLETRTADFTADYQEEEMLEQSVNLGANVQAHACPISAHAARSSSQQWCR